MLAEEAGMKVIAIVPGYNEARNIAPVVRKVMGYVDEVLVVDDGSADDTARVAAAAGATVLRHIVNCGKGAALTTGCEYAIGKGADAIVAIDADGQHDPAEIPKFLKALRNSDIVFGYRKLSREMPLELRFGNWFISTATWVLFRIRIYDTLCGFRAFTAAAYKKLKWTSSDYSVESEMIANAGKHRLKFRQVGIATIYLDRYKGKTMFDGMKIVLSMLWWKIRSIG